MSRRLLHSVAPFFGLVLSAVAFWALHRALKEYHYRDFLDALHSLPMSQLFIATALTVFSYFLLTCYDALACRYISNPLPYGRITLVSFIGYALSNSIGHSYLSGGTVRYRFYSSWGLNTIEIAKVIAFCTATAWLGLATLGGVSCLLEPAGILQSPVLSAALIRPLGMVLLALPVSYLALSFARRRLTARWRFPLPSAGLALSQTLLGGLDMAVAGGVLYALLPSGTAMSYPAFLGCFILAILGGLTSQVPGGLGVFETLLIVLLPPDIPRPQVLSALVLFRFIYYVIPLLMALLLLAGYEVRQRRAALYRIGTAFGTMAAPLVPQLYAFGTFVCGTVLLISGSLPALQGRMKFLERLLPIYVIDFSHFIASLLGVALIFLGRELQRRVDAAYWLTLMLLAGGSCFSLLKGFDYEEAIILTLMFGLLLPSHRHFYRKASLLAPRFEPGWAVALGVVILGSIWLGMFAHKHVEYSNDLWWHFSIRGDAPRFLRASVGVLVFAQFIAFARLFRSAPHRPTPATSDDTQTAEAIARQARETSANLALLGDKSFLFNDKRNALIMYAVEGRCWVAMGDPIGPETERSELVWRFKEFCDRYDAWPVFYQVRPECVHLYLDVGLNLLKIGEEGIVDLSLFSLEGHSRKEERHIVRRLEKEGYTFNVVPVEEAPALLPDLKALSDEWLREKSTREKGFSLGRFDEAYLRRFPLALVKKDARTVAFANVWQSAGFEELSIDLMRYGADAPSGVMDYLFVKLMLWGKEKGYHWFNIGMVPLAGLESRAQAPLWHRVGGMVYRHGEHFYNFQGLRQYKAKFDPVWQPRYIASPGGLALPRVLANVASLISGGPAGILTK